MTSTAKKYIDGLAIIFFRLNVGESKEINLEKQGTLSKILSWYMYHGGRDNMVQRGR
jgi:hypothetical protein